MKDIKDLVIYLESFVEKDPYWGPGIIRTNLRKEYSHTYLRRYKLREDAYWAGFYLADSKIPEAIKEGDITKHMNMALNWFKELLEKYEIEEKDQQIVTEIILSHHGTDHKFKESQVFTNADAMSFLEPKGFLHMFGAYFNDGDEADFLQALEKAYQKADEKLKLVDIDQQTIDEANALFERIKWMVIRMGYDENALLIN